MRCRPLDQQGIASPQSSDYLTEKAVSGLPLTLPSPSGRGFPALYSIPSSSMIIPSIIFRPICQKPGSFASRPKGASSSP